MQRAGVVRVQRAGHGGCRVLSLIVHVFPLDSVGIQVVDGGQTNTTWEGQHVVVGMGKIHKPLPTGSAQRLHGGSGCGGFGEVLRGKVPSRLAWSQTGPLGGSFLCECSQASPGRGLVSVLLPGCRRGLSSR